MAQESEEGDEILVACYSASSSSTISLGTLVPSVANTRITRVYS